MPILSVLKPVTEYPASPFARFPDLVNVAQQGLNSLWFPRDPAVDKEVIEVGCRDLNALAVRHDDAQPPSVSPEQFRMRNRLLRKSALRDETQNATLGTLSIQSSHSPPPRRAQALLLAPAEVVLLDLGGPGGNVDLAGGVELFVQPLFAEDIARMNLARRILGAA